jgi:hypothetical protein
VNNNIAEWLAAFERKVLRRMFGGSKVNENWRKRFNKLLMQVFGDFDMLLFLRINMKNCIGHFNGLVKYLTKNRWLNCVQTNVNR